MKNEIKKFSRGPRVRQGQTPAPIVHPVAVFPCGGRWQARSVVGDALVREFDTRADATMYADAFNKFCTADGHSVYGAP